MALPPTRDGAPPCGVAAFGLRSRSYRFGVSPNPKSQPPQRPTTVAKQCCWEGNRAGRAAVAQPLLAVPVKEPGRKRRAGHDPGAPAGLPPALENLRRADRPCRKTLYRLTAPAREPSAGSPPAAESLRRAEHPFPGMARMPMALLAARDRAPSCAGRMPAVRKLLPA